MKVLFNSFHLRIHILRFCSRLNNLALDFDFRIGVGWKLIKTTCEEHTSLVLFGVFQDLSHHFGEV